ncbi:MULTISPECIES: hypothetical protein [Microbacterium]|uniref:hypothetical protein n=1 Tax=Microbacterium TaxID=33882 RepID=UPI0018E0AE2F|nr:MULTISPECIES: hypothetical protein [Microbacterium]
MSHSETPDAAPDAGATMSVDAPPVPSAVPPAFAPPAAFEAEASDSAPAAAAEPPSGPRVRWAGIVWGLVLAAIAALALWVLTDPARHATVTAWMLHLTPAAVTAYAVLLVGGFALVAGVVGLARRAQRALERRRPSAAG